MVDFDKFEKNVKHNYGNQEFPFDEQNWEKAAQMIDASRKGKNRGGIILWSAAALLCTSGLVYYFGFSDGAKGLMNKDLAVNQTITSNKKNNTTNENSASENNSDVNTTDNSNEGNVQSDLNTTTTTENVSTENTSSNNSSNVNINSKNNSSVSSSNSAETISNTKSANENSNSTSNNETKTETKANTASTNTSNETKSNNPKNTESKKSPVKSNVKTAKPPVLGSNNSAQNNTEKPVAPVTNLNETGNTNKEGELTNSSNSETTTKSNVVVTDSTPVVVAVSVKPTESVVVDSVPAIRKSKADSLAAMFKGDGVSYATNVKEKHNAKNILFMEAGTTYLLGWNGGGKNEAGGFNLLAGLNFQHYFTGTIAAQIGVQYSTISNLTNSTHTIGTVNYDLGMEQEVTSISYQKLHYVVAPIKFTYNIGDKNIIGVGCNIAYLLNSNSKKENYKTYSSDPNATKNELKSTKESGYVQGFNPLDIQVGVSYRRKIYKGLSANAEFFYGLTDTKNNEFFKSNYFDRNVGFKVSLCYDLFKK